MQQHPIHSSSAKQAPYGVYVTVGGVIVAVVTLLLFFWSGKHIIVPTDPSRAPTPSEAISAGAQTGAATDDIEVLGTEAQAFDVSTLDTQLGVIDQDK